MIKSKINQKDPAIKQKKTWLKPEIEIINEIESGSSTGHLEGSFTVGSKGHKLFLS